jgi:adenosylhomocysteine nucleosidase
MSGPRIEELVERAFGYRGYVTLWQRDGTQRIGFVYGRGPGHVEMFDETATSRVRVALDDIANITLTGEDSAAKAHEIWERRRGSLESAVTSAWGDWEERPALVLVALAMELRSVAAALGATGDAAIVRGWMGERRAVALAVGPGGGAAHAVEAERPHLVISCGFCGALDGALRSGDVVLASSVCDETGDSLRVPEPIVRVARDALAGHATVAVGEILCATRVAATREEKQALARPGRRAVDLESWAAARAARDAGIPWLGLRVVLDPLDVALPAFTRELRRSYLAPAVRHALGGPQAALDLVRLHQRARTASRALGRALHRLGPVVADLGPERTS